VIPASFAPMLLKLLMPKIMDHFMKVFKLDKVLQYVEQPNELDIEAKKHREQIDMLAGELGMLENRLNKLEILSSKSKKLKSNAK
tara:strand:+ start:2337 stop:2591 length:255 start_codon:yes stop_codon:yes gene_type:complete